MKRILVTGANKGIGLATVENLLQNHPDTFLILGSRDEKRGDKALGFLTSTEIMELNIKADFVNLSACETALGKKYLAEGVVGLTGSFLIAGANGVSTTLWPVSDKSTAMFKFIL